MSVTSRIFVCGTNPGFVLREIAFCVKCFKTVIVKTKPYLLHVRACWKVLSPTRLKKGRHFSSDAEVIAVAETWLEGQTSEFLFLSGLQKLQFGRCKVFPSWSG